MSTTLVLDTETSGFPNHSLSPSDPRQGRIVSLAFALIDDNCEVMLSYYALIKASHGRIISSGAMGQHGITDEMCEQYGVMLVDALDAFQSAHKKASKCVVFNLQFDKQIINNEEVVTYGESQSRFDRPEDTCLMRAMTDVCRLPHYNGKAGFKWPKLGEAYRHCYGKDFEGAHNSMADVNATIAIYEWALKSGAVVTHKSLAV